MSRKIIIPAILSLGIAGMLYGCSTTPKMTEALHREHLNDGTYQGHFKGGLNTARVEITIHDRQIDNVVILEHDALKGKKAEDPIVRRILEKQSADVEAVSGATNSSHVIVNAVQQALNKACGE